VQLAAMPLGQRGERRLVGGQGFDGGNHARVTAARPKTHHAKGEAGVATASASRVCREDVGDGSAAENDGARPIDGERCEEEPLAGTENYRVDDKSVLVDQPGQADHSRAAPSAKMTAGDEAPRTPRDLGQAQDRRAL
jgi:hypothetical protein